MEGIEEKFGKHLGFPEKGGEQIEKLPSGLLEHILTFLSNEDLKNTVLTNKNWKNATLNSVQIQEKEYVNKLIDYLQKEIDTNKYTDLINSIKEIKKYQAKKNSSTIMSVLREFVNLHGKLIEELVKANIDLEKLKKLKENYLKKLPIEDRKGIDFIEKIFEKPIVKASFRSQARKMADEIKYESNDAEKVQTLRSKISQLRMSKFDLTESLIDLLPPNFRDQEFFLLVEAIDEKEKFEKAPDIIENIQREDVKDEANAFHGMALIKNYQITKGLQFLRRIGTAEKNEKAYEELKEYIQDELPEANDETRKKIDLLFEKNATLSGFITDIFDQKLNEKLESFFQVYDLEK